VESGGRSVPRSGKWVADARPETAHMSLYKVEQVHPVGVEVEIEGTFPTRAKREVCCCGGDRRRNVLEEFVAETSQRRPTNALR
jgi:hypothetical protein